MFSELREYALRKYGAKLLNTNEAQNIINKAVELKILSLPNVQLSSQMTTNELLTTIKTLENKEGNKASLDGIKEDKITNIGQTEVNISKNSLADRPENVEKLEKVLSAFLEYEKLRLNRKRRSFKWIPITILSTITVASAFLYFNYTPPPY